MTLHIIKDNNQKRVTPILKWAGGKTQLLPELNSRMPLHYNNYIEPFFGGGALFFANNPDSAILADINPELVNLYTTVAKEPHQIINKLKTYQNSEEFFYEMRAKDYNSLSNIEKAARTLFINKTCFNGLYRVNKKGGFNTPYGRYKNPNFVNEDGI